MSALTLLASAPLHTICTNDGETVEGFIVKFKDNATKRAFASYHLPAESRSRWQSMITADWDHGIPGGLCGTFDDEILDILRRCHEVEYIEQDAEVTYCASEVVIQTQTNAPWGLQRISQRGPVNNKGEEALTYTYKYEAREPATAGVPVDIYVLDTGIMTTHVDFGGRASWGATFIGTPGVDKHGHGTHCAGTAGGTQYGAAKDAKLIAVKVLGDNGKGRKSTLISGLDWVAQTVQATGRASVASMSLGGGVSKTVDGAVNNLSLSYGVHVVVAAGNQNEDAKNRSPARAAEAIAIGASNISDARARFSNYGSTVAVFAPGVKVVSAGIASDTAKATKSGTSMATPHVSGLVANWINVWNNVPPREMKAIVRGMATEGVLSDIPSGTDNLLAYNRDDPKV